MPLIFFIFLLFSDFSVAEVVELEEKDEYSLAEPSRKRSDFWFPLASFFLPGLDQWMEGQHKYAGVYSGGAVLAYFYGSYHRKKLLFDYKVSTDDFQPENRRSRNFHYRSYGLGFQTWMTFGGVSAYHGFRSAVRTRQLHGEYSFLGAGESIKTIALAPFRFSFLKRKTTWIPLVLAGIASSLSFDIDVKRFTLDDGFFASAISYNAGLWEEAVFRGWLMPHARENIGSDFYANLLTSSLFALAHLSASNPTPWPQFIAGYYFGYLTQRNNWNISESIFVHAWWDLIVIAASYAGKNKGSFILLPPLTIYF